MKVSIFTPSHDSSYLPKVWESLKAQTDQDFEWIILWNNGATQINFHDPRVKCHLAENAPDWVGPLKKAACGLCAGDVVLELDHDDILMPSAIEEVKKAFLDPAVGFVYSNAIYADADLNPGLTLDPAMGWTTRQTEVYGKMLPESIAFPPTPESVSRIWFGPNHLRAWRKTVYDQVGGHDDSMRILDDADLMCRTYQVTKFHHIDRGLYVYRVHGKNAWLRYNHEIQENVYRLYDKYIEKLVEAWCDRCFLRKLDLGGAFNSKAGYETVDLEGANVNCDLEKKWPFEDNSVGVIRAFDIIEELSDPIHFMKEASRVLVPGGFIFACVPSTDGRGAFQSPTHKSYFNQNSFLYYTDRKWAQYIGTPVTYQAVRLLTMPKNEIEVCWTIAHLINLKNGYRPCGEVNI